MNMKDTPPRSIFRELREFCSSISPSSPKFVRSKPSKDAILSHCFDNVERKIQRAGGSVAYGWAIWHLRGAYFEAEYHGVWRKRSGELLDVSPQLNSYRKILFLPDDNAIYDPTVFRTNIMLAEQGNPVAGELVNAALERNSILNQYRQPGVSEVTLSRADQDKVNDLLAKIQRLFQQLSA